MHPISYSKGIKEMGNIIKKTKIIPDYINIGGGFPTIYPDLNTSIFGKLYGMKLKKV